MGKERRQTAGRPENNAERKQTLSKPAYFLGLAVVLAVIYSQYFFHFKNIFASFLIIYGVPIFFVTFVSGWVILKKAFRNNLVAAEWGLASWGLLLLASYVADLVIFNILLALYPQGLLSLNRPSPLLHIGLSPWAMIAVSFLIIGPAEEYIFRGFVFGGALRAFPKVHWSVLAVLASALFALVHFYYFLLFGAASGLIVPDIFAIGLALSATYYFSGGNLLIPILLHALFDSFGFLSLATGTNVGNNLRLLLVGAGILMAIYLAGKHSLPGATEKPTAALET